MYLVVSFGIHNFKVQKAWEEHEVEMKKLKDEYVALKESVLETTWNQSFHALMWRTNR